MQYKYVCRGVYKLTWQTCAKPYMGHMDSRLKIRFDLQQRYIRTHNVVSVYAVHILNKGHECGSVHETMKLTKYCEKDGSLICWKNFYVFSHKQNGIGDRWTKTCDRNPLYAITQDRAHVHEQTHWPLRSQVVQDETRRQTAPPTMHDNQSHRVCRNMWLVLYDTCVEDMIVNFTRTLRLYDEFH
jgi:hypothetical protein